MGCPVPIESARIPSVAYKQDGSNFLELDSHFITIEPMESLKTLLSVNNGLLANRDVYHVYAFEKYMVVFNLLI